MVDVRAFIESHIEDIQREFKKSEIRTYAASTAYCMFLSVLPALIVVSAILPYTPLSEADMVDFLLMVFPDSSEGVVRAICNETYRVSGAVLPVSIIVMLWSAGFGMMQLMKGINTIYDAKEKRNYFLLRLVGTLYMLLIMALMIAILFFQVFAKQLVDLWQSVLPYAAPPDILTSALRYVFLFGAAVVLFLLLFTAMPARKVNVWNQLPGAITAAAGWGVLGALFALYARFSSHLNAYYGSLTTVVVLLFWVYWSLYIMLFGAFLNRFIELYVLPLMNGGEAGDAEKRSDGFAGPIRGHGNFCIRVKTGKMRRNRPGVLR